MATSAKWPGPVGGLVGHLTGLRESWTPTRRAARTSVAEEERDAPWPRALLVHKVNAEASEAVYVYGRLELRQLSVEFGLVGAPVVAVFPVLGEAEDVVSGCSVVPVIGEVNLVGEIRQFQLGFQLRDGGVGDVNLEWGDACHFCPLVRDYCAVTL